MSWLASLFTKIISNLGMMGLQALIDWAKSKYESYQEKKKQKIIKDETKKYEEAANVKDKKDAFRNIVNTNSSDS